MRRVFIIITGFLITRSGSLGVGLGVNLLTSLGDDDGGGSSGGSLGGKNLPGSVDDAGGLHGSGDNGDELGCGGSGGQHALHLQVDVGLPRLPFQPEQRFLASIFQLVNLI